MGELDSLHCIFQITLTECLAQGHLFFFKKKQNRNLKTTKYLNKNHQVLPNSISNPKATNLKIHKPTQNNVKSKLRRLN